MGLPSVWRCTLPNAVKLVIVEADEVVAERAGSYSDFVMQALSLHSCKHLKCEWPFHSIVSLEQLLVQLDASLQG